MSCGKNKCEEYRKAHQAAHDGMHVQCGAPPPPSSFVPEVQQPPATSVSSSVLKAPQPPATSSLSSTTAPMTAHPQMFRVMMTSWQEANANITLDLLVAGMSIEGSEQSLEYYEERVEQGGSQLKFRDIKSLPGNTHSLLRVEEAAVYLPAPPQKKKHHSHCKMMDTDEEDLYSSFSEDSLGSDDGGPLSNPPKDNQMDVDNSSPSQM